MKIKDIILKKEKNQELTEEEISFLMEQYVSEEINDKQMTKFLKAVLENSLNEKETISLTRAMLQSGKILSLPFTDRLVADKHSTGGVGDKTTLIVASIVSACGVPVIKMSGRSLGSTGGTIDKLESIPGFNVSLSEEEMLSQLKEIDVVITSQTDDIAVADKKLYALRDKTNTVSSVALIASSIMSKKIATGADVIVLDVKFGNGALIQELKEAKELANLMIKIGKSFNKKVLAVISDMSEPLGYNVGNSLEIEEVLDVLENDKEGDLLSLSKTIAAWMISLAKNMDFQIALFEAEKRLRTGEVYKKCLELINYQGGKIKEMSKAKYTYHVKSGNSGYVSSINARLIEEFVFKLAKRNDKKENDFDKEAGIILNKKRGDYVKEGEVILTIYSNYKLEDIKALGDFITYSDLETKSPDLILDIIK